MKTKLKVWDYKIPENWKPKTNADWLWYLERRINYDDFKGLEINRVKEFLPQLKIDQGKRLLLNAYFKKYSNE